MTASRNAFLSTAWRWGHGSDSERLAAAASAGQQVPYCLVMVDDLTASIGRCPMRGMT
jgi:hypothetical protein